MSKFWVETCFTSYLFDELFKQLLIFFSFDKFRLNILGAIVVFDASKISCPVSLVVMYSVCFVAIECFECEFIREPIVCPESVMAVAFEKGRLVSTRFEHASDLVGIGAIVLVSGSAHGLFFYYYRFRIFYKGVRFQLNLTSWI